MAKQSDNPMNFIGWCLFFGTIPLAVWVWQNLGVWWSVSGLVLWLGFVVSRLDPEEL